jgi:hypothetical protein
VLLEEDSPVDSLGKSKKDPLIVSSAELNSQRGNRFKLSIKFIQRLYISDKLMRMEILRTNTKNT